MNMNKMKLSLLVLTVLIFLPTTSEAATGATLLNSTTALFTIDFTVSDKSFNNQIPVAAKYGVEYQDRVDTLGYRIVRDRATGPAIKEVNALVLSSNPIEGVRYQVDKGTEAKFTLFILATFEEPITGEALRAEVTKLPYFIDGRRTTVHERQLVNLHSSTLVILGE